MKTSIHHVHLNVSSAKRSLPFYKALLRYLGYHFVDESPSHIGASNGTTDLWVVEADGKHRKCPFHRKGAGLNHIAFRVPTRKAVDEFAWKFLRRRGIDPLYGSPRLFPEYRKGYYAVYFEDPDRVKLEVVHFPRTRPKRR